MSSPKNPVILWNMTARELKKFAIEKLRQSFDLSFFIFLSLAIVSGYFVFEIKGAAVFGTTFNKGIELLIALLPKIGAALLLAGFIRALISPELIGRWLGKKSGLKGILLGTLISLFTPGPVAAFSVMGALKVAGADKGVLVAFATGWSLMGVHRIILWEWSFLGPDFLILRLTVSFFLPIAAGFVARQIPMELDPLHPQAK